MSLPGSRTGADHEQIAVIADFGQRHNTVLFLQESEKRIPMRFVILMQVVVDGLVLAVNHFSFGKEIARKCSARASFHQLFKATSWNHFSMDIDSVLNKDAIDSLVFTVAAKP